MTTKVAITGLLCIMAASAQNTKLCNPDTYVDGAVQVQRSRLVSRGADVRVINLQSMDPYPTLDAYEAYAESSCPDWRAPNGNRKNNLLVFMAAVKERKLGLYYGSQWASELRTQWPTIQGQYMAPRFREGKYVQGFSDAMDQVYNLLAAQSLGDASRPITVTHGTIEITHGTIKTPTDYSGFWKVFLGFLALGFLLAGGFSYIKGKDKARDRKARAKASQRKALMYRDEASNLVIELSDGIAGADIQACSEAKGYYNAAMSEYSQLGSGSGDASNDGLESEEYEAISDRYVGIIKKLHTACNTAQTAKAPKQVPVEPKPTPGKPTDTVTSETTTNHESGYKHNPKTHKTYEEPIRVERHTTVEHIHHYDNPYPVIPVIIDTPIYVAPVREYAPPVQEYVSPPAPEPEPVPSWGSSGGGSTDWGDTSQSTQDSPSDYGSADSGGGSTDY